MPKHVPHPNELRKRAVRMVRDHADAYGWPWKAIRSVAEKLGPRPMAGRLCGRRAEADGKRRPGPTSGELAEVKRLGRENAEQHRANDVLTAVARFPAAELDHQSRKRPRSTTRTATPSRRGFCGGEPIRRVLQAAPSTLYTTKRRPRSARAVGDAELTPQIRRVLHENQHASGADTTWGQPTNHSITVARCTVDRLMRQMDIHGCRRGRAWVRTTEADDPLGRPADPVGRTFQASAANVR